MFPNVFSTNKNGVLFYGFLSLEVLKHDQWFMVAEIDRNSKVFVRFFFCQVKIRDQRMPEGLLKLVSWTRWPKVEVSYVPVNAKIHCRCENLSVSTLTPNCYYFSGDITTKSNYEWSRVSFSFNKKHIGSLMMFFMMTLRDFRYFMSFILFPNKIS